MAAKAKLWKFILLFIAMIFTLFGIIVFYLKHKLGQLECAATSKGNFTFQRYLITLKTFLFGSGQGHTSNTSLLCGKDLNEVCMHILMQELPVDTKYYLVDFWEREPELREFVFRILAVIGVVALIIYCNLCKWMTAHELHYTEDYEEKTVRANLKALGEKYSKQMNTYVPPSVPASSRLFCPTNSPRFPSPGERYNYNCCQAWSIWKIIGVIVAVFTILSIPWEFARLYQKEVSKRAARASIGSPPECSPRDMTVVQGFRSWAQRHFSWDHRHDPCEDYYYVLLVDPLWELTPLMVLSSALTRCILHPLEQLFSGLGRCCRVFFSEIPAQWQPVVMTLLLLVGLVLLLMVFGYRLSVPLLFHMEPRTPEGQRYQDARGGPACSYGRCGGHGDHYPGRLEGDVSPRRPVSSRTLKARARKSLS